MTGVLILGHNIHTGRKPCVYQYQYQKDVTTNQNYQQTTTRGKSMDQLLPHSPQKKQILMTLDLWLLASRTNVCCLSHQFVTVCCSSPHKLIHFIFTYNSPWLLVKTQTLWPRLWSPNCFTCLLMRPFWTILSALKIYQPWLSTVYSMPLC